MNYNLLYLDISVEHLSEKQARVMIMDSLLKLNSFFCFNLELGIKIFTLVLALLGYLPPSFIMAWLADNTTFLWIVYLPVLVNVIAFGLASFALQWNKTRELLIPAAVLAPIWSLFSLIFVMVVPVLELQSGTGVIFLHLVFVLSSSCIQFSFPTTGLA